MARCGRPPFLLTVGCRQQVPVRGFVHYHFAGAVRPHCLAADHFLPATAADDDERKGERRKPFFLCSPRPACWSPPPPSPPQVFDSIPPPKDIIRRRRPDRSGGRFSNTASCLRICPHFPTC